MSTFECTHHQLISLILVRTFSFTFTLQHWACQTPRLTCAPLSNITVPHLIISSHLFPQLCNNHRLEYHKRVPSLSPPFFLKISPRASCWVAYCHAVLSSHRSLIFLSRQLVAASPLVHRHLAVLPSCCLIAPDGCCIASRHTTLSSFRHPLTALPSLCIILLAGCCVMAR